MYGLMRFWLGDGLADEFQAPNARWKYAGHVMRVAVGGYELARRLRLIDDEKACAAAIRLLDDATRARPGQAVLAPTDEVVTSIEQTRSPALS
jgi:hypothetical protein